MVHHVVGQLYWDDIEMYVCIYLICHSNLCFETQGPCNGKSMFVGCSLWSHQDESMGYSPHWSMQIPPNVCEDILKQIFDCEVIQEDDLLDTPPCPYIAHPQTKKRITPGCCMDTFFVMFKLFTDLLIKIAYNHIENGCTVVGIIKPHIKCDSKLSIFVPCNKSDYCAVVILGSAPHNHPIHVQAKVPYNVRRQYSACVVASGAVRMTLSKIDHGNIWNNQSYKTSWSIAMASQTKALLDRKSPQEIHPSLINTWRRAHIVKSVKDKKPPQGSGISGENASIVFLYQYQFIFICW